MGDAAERVPSFDELYAEIGKLREGLTGEILQPGTIRTMSRPSGRHRFGTRRVLSGLGSFDVADGGAGWWFEIEAEVRLLRDRLAVPDLSGWRTEGVPTFIESNPITVVPDWACEILSPSTRADDRVLKLPLYARAGVEWIWLVDPEACTVEVFQTVEGKPQLVATARDTERAALPPFGAELDIGRFWLTPAAAASSG